MLDMLKVRFYQGYQAIRDVKKVSCSPMFRGLPVINAAKCKAKCEACVLVCSSRAVSKKPLSIDMGKCTFCGDCVRACPNGALALSNFHKTSATERDRLVIDESMTEMQYEKNAVTARAEIVKLFGRSLKLRQVSAGGCNGCEMELNACSNVNFDMGRFGIEFVASPRHADGIVITGPITENMAAALRDTYDAVPDPRIIIAAGACAISGGVFAGSDAVDRSFFDEQKIDLYIPGCPIHPLTFINGVLSFLGQ